MDVAAWPTTEGALDLVYREPKTQTPGPLPRWRDSDMFYVESIFDQWYMRRVSFILIGQPGSPHR